jgi:3-oxoacyl-[acyl-carrier-protein] synthase III
VSARAGLYGIGDALPARRITNDDWAARLQTSDEWIVRRTGIRTRHWLDGEETLSELAARACTAALADAGRDASEVDHVICSTFTPDKLTPGLAPEVALAIGAVDASAVDVNAACAGFLYGLDQAAALVETGRAGVVLVCGAEALSRVTDAADRSTAVLWGDGAGAAVVATADPAATGTAHFVLGADGTHAGLLYADASERVLRMRGPEVYRHAVARMVSATRAALRASGLTVEDLDLFVAHQANARIIEAAALELGVPEDRVIVDVGRVANTSSASIPLALAQAQRDDRLHEGAVVGLTAFGAGFVWAAGIATFKERAGVPA